MRVLIYVLLFVLPASLSAQEFPEKSDRLVNDYSEVLSKSEVNELERLLVDYDNESSVQVAIVVMKTLDGYPIDEYSFKLGEEWGIGQADSDNGALILVSMNERKMAIASGYGLEGVLTDALSKRIIENEMKPRFRKEDYFGGLKAASLAIVQVSRGEYQGQGNGGSQGKNPPIPFIVLAILIFGVVWIVKAVQVNTYAKRNHIGFWAAWMLLNASSRRHGGSWSSFSGGSGGFSGGGGFGGFGGGSFGGGGASGSW